MIRSLFTQFPSFGLEISSALSLIPLLSQLISSKFTGCVRISHLASPASPYIKFVFSSRSKARAEHLRVAVRFEIRSAYL